MLRTKIILGVLLSLIAGPLMAQEAKVTSLIDSGVIRPVVDRVFPFSSTKDAMAYVEAGRAKGKVVVSVRES